MAPRRRETRAQTSGLGHEKGSSFLRPPRSPPHFAPRPGRKSLASLGQVFGKSVHLPQARWLYCVLRYSEDTEQVRLLPSRFSSRLPILHGRVWSSEKKPTSSKHSSGTRTLSALSLHLYRSPAESKRNIRQLRPSDAACLIQLPLMTTIMMAITMYSIHCDLNKVLLDVPEIRGKIVEALGEVFLSEKKGADVEWPESSLEARLETPEVQARFQKRLQDVLKKIAASDWREETQTLHSSTLATSPSDRMPALHKPDEDERLGNMKIQWARHEWSAQ